MNLQIFTSITPRFTGFPAFHALVVNALFRDQLLYIALMMVVVLVTSLMLTALLMLTESPELLMVKAERGSSMATAPPHLLPYLLTHPPPVPLIEGNARGAALFACFSLLSASRSATSAPRHHSSAWPYHNSLALRSRPRGFELYQAFLVWRSIVLQVLRKNQASSR